MKCPVDGATLAMTERSGVEIDYCPQCRGVWLDRGELDKILARAQAPVTLEEPAPAAPPAEPPHTAPPPIRPRENPREATRALTPEQLPKAFLVRAPGSTLDEDAVKAYMAEKVAPHKKIRLVEFIETVPKSAAGKILRKELRART